MLITGIYLYLAPELPEAEQLLNVDLQTPLRLYTADGKLITEFGEKRRTPITFEQVPPQFINALLASEDDGFFEHSGVDVKGLARAVFQLVTTGQKKSGGSTITMQVAKNYYLTSEKTFTRKFTEIMLALKIERALSKQQILELYINKIYLGKRAYGIEAASQVYYNKSINELSLAQLAMIAGLPQAPSAANPINSPNRAILRRNYVLARMRNLEKITQEEFIEAANAPVTARYYGANSEVSAPYIAEMVRREMVDQYGDEAYTKGFNVFTTIKSDRQLAANVAVQKGLLSYDRDHGYRGPEKNLNTIRITDVPNNPILADWLKVADNSFDINWPATLEQWHTELNKYGSDGLINSAVVLDTRKDGALLYSLNGFVWLPFEGMAWAAPYLSINSFGKKPTSVTDVMKQGDIIWYEINGQSTRLAERPKAESALVSLDPNSGALQALVGGFSNTGNQFNRAIQAERQPGSAFKPFIYSSALANGLNTASIINDAPVVFDSSKIEDIWRPDNSSGKFYGPTRMREALIRSQNLVSIRMLDQIGMKAAFEHIRKFGFDTSTMNRDLSLALGSSAVTPMQLARAYAVIANDGYLIDPYFIERIEDSMGNVLYEATPKMTPQLAPLCGGVNVINNDNLTEQNHSIAQCAPRVLDSENRFLMVSMMQDVIRKGTGRRALVLKRADIAGKTGTTNDQKDAWFSGFNPEVVSTVWVGLDSPTTLGRYASGGTTALPIWIDYMRVALKDLPVANYPQPENIFSVRIDPENGLLAAPGQSNAIFEYFRENEIPTQYTPYYSNGLGEDVGLDEVIPEQLF
ncbi:MAG: penicillin-binding protein 1A [Oleibacter sp.]|nr:penicillin-binding protein 1A [Thalassolituus sp.]